MAHQANMTEVQYSRQLKAERRGGATGGVPFRQILHMAQYKTSAPQI
jgi:hypothetical protein